MTVRAYLFDLDDTLGNRRVYAYKTYARRVDELFPGMDPLTREVILQHCMILDQHGDVNKGYVRDGILKKWKIDLGADFNDWWESVLWQQMVLFDDAMDVIRELKGRGYLVGVVTNGSASGQNHKLEKAGLKEILDDWVVSGDIGIHKPDPAIYRLAADRLHVACDECVFIGDLWQTDLYGACLAGMKPVWMNTEGSPVQEYKKIPQIRRLRELLELNF